MTLDAQPAGNPKWMVWAGWIIGVLPALALLACGVLSFLPAPPEQAETMERIMERMGWHTSSVKGLGVLMIVGSLLYLFPRTAVLGAVVFTGYLGGALATHVRVGDPLVPNFVLPLTVALVLWMGLVLRDARVRAVLPWRSSTADSSAPRGGFLSLIGKTFITVLALAVVLAGLVVAVPDDYEITRSATIDAPPAAVFANVNDFHKWDAWNPWKKLDPAAKITIEGPTTGIGAIYQWAGNDNMGEGKMTILDNKPDERIKIKLEFIKPLKEEADTVFSFKPDGNKTLVTWTMKGKHDIPTKIICVLIGVNKIVGDQFDEGLASLKKTVEGAGKK
jgi:uncharacterized protein YndB with AHSA1/START domain